MLDVSGSMDDYWGSGANRTKKINTARNVLVEFNNMLRPDLGDQAGLVKYPITLANNPTYYYPSCGGSRTKALYGAEVVQSLTLILQRQGRSPSSANGWTPLAASMQKGFEAVLDPAFHEEDHIPIIILASDGMGNIRLDGKMTNWSGTSPQEPTCNTPASADAIDMANQTKASGVTLFTVGIGNFLTYVLEAISTPDSKPQYPHFLQASDPDAMQQIYDSLENASSTSVGSALSFRRIGGCRRVGDALQGMVRSWRADYGERRRQVPVQRRGARHLRVQCDDHQ